MSDHEESEDERLYREDQERVRMEQEAIDHRTGAASSPARPSSQSTTPAPVAMPQPQQQTWATLDPRVTHVAMTQEQEAAFEAMEPPVNVDVPHVQQEGSVLTCTMGNWDGEPTHYSYQWRIDGAPAGTDSPSLQLSQADVGKTATCVVTAGNAKGIVEAPPSTEVVIEGPPEEGAARYDHS